MPLSARTQPAVLDAQLQELAALKEGGNITDAEYEQAREFVEEL